MIHSFLLIGQSNMAGRGFTHEVEPIDSSRIKAKATARNYLRINEALQSMANKDPMMAFVSAEGLPANADNLHFSAAGLREFGLRYYEAFRLLERKDKVFPEKCEADAAIRNELEYL